MRYIELRESEIIELIERNECSDNKVERKRCHCLLLSHKRHSINDIVKILGMPRSTIIRLFDSWSKYKYDSLRIKSGRGPKYKLSNMEEVIEQQLREHNRNLNTVLNHLEEHHQLIVSKDTLKRFLKD